MKSILKFSPILHLCNFLTAITPIIQTAIKKFPQGGFKRILDMLLYEKSAFQ